MDDLEAMAAVETHEMFHHLGRTKRQAASVGRSRDFLDTPQQPAAHTAALPHRIDHDPVDIETFLLPFVSGVLTASS